MKSETYPLLMYAQALLPGMREPKDLGSFICILIWLKVWSDHWHAHPSEGEPPPALGKDGTLAMATWCTFTDLLNAKGAVTVPAILQAIAELGERNPALGKVLQPMHFSMWEQLANAAKACALKQQRLMETINQISFEHSAPSVACATEFAAVIAAVYNVLSPLLGSLAPLCARLLQPQAGEVVLDPACAQGDLLLACASELAEGAASATTQPQAMLQLHGMAHDVCDWSLTKMLLSLAGLPYEHIQHANPLLKPWAELSTAEKALAMGGADIVVMAIPETNWPWCNPMAYHEQDPRLSGRTPADSRVLLVWQALAALKAETGRMALLLPSPVLDVSGGKALRQYLVENDLLDAVISLPGLTAPVLLIIRSQRKQTDIAFIQAPGTSAAANMCALAAWQHYQAGQADPCLVRIAKSRVAANYYDFNLQMYGKEISDFYAQSRAFCFSRLGFP